MTLSVPEHPDEAEDGDEPEEVMVVYRPGFPLAASLKGALGRFFPGALVSFAAVVAFMGGVPQGGEFGEAVLMVLFGAAGMTAGFAAGLESLRRWLYPDAKIAGRKSFIAGLMAPVAVFVVGALMSGPPGIPALMALLVLVPLALSLLMFFAWLTPTPEHLRDEEYVEPDELPGMMLRSWPADGDLDAAPETAAVAASGAEVKGPT